VRQWQLHYQAIGCGDQLCWTNPYGHIAIEVSSNGLVLFAARPEVRTYPFTTSVMEKSCLEVNSERLSILGYPVVLIGPLCA